jgi:thymidylate synthase
MNILLSPLEIMGLLFIGIIGISVMSIVGAVVFNLVSTRLQKDKLKQLILMEKALKEVKQAENANKTIESTNKATEKVREYINNNAKPPTPPTREEILAKATTEMVNIIQNSDKLEYVEELSDEEAAKREKELTNLKDKLSGDIDNVFNSYNIPKKNRSVLTDITDVAMRQFMGLGHKKD